MQLAARELTFGATIARSRRPLAITARDEPRIEQVLARGVGEAAFKFIAIVTCKHERVQQRPVLIEYLGGVARASYGFIHTA